MRFAALLLILASFAPAMVAQQPTVTWYTPVVYGETDLIINIQSAHREHNAYLVTISWEAGDQAETVTRMVRRSNWDGTGVPMQFWVTFTLLHIPAGDPRITRIQVLPVTTHDNQIILLTPGVGALPK